MQCTYLDAVCVDKITTCLLTTIHRQLNFLIKQKLNQIQFYIDVDDLSSEFRKYKKKKENIQTYIRKSIEALK